MLENVLSATDAFVDPRVMVGYEKADDAGVYLLTEDTAIVQSIDFFTPVVDDPFQYGQIAAANSLSDIYAMGGVPRFALSVVAFPIGEVDEDILHEIVRGGSDKMKEARVAVIGGHSVQDPEIKFGYCATGTVNPQKVYTNGGAKAGDVLVLTKPLGTGIVATGIKFGKTPPRIADKAIQWMLQLNSHVADQLTKFDVHAVTDITGCGLIGHGYEMARASGITIAFEADRIPILEGVEELARRRMLAGGIESNRRYVGSSISWGGVNSLRQKILLDPQTSGGLLISLPQEEGMRLCRELEGQGYLGRLVGQVLPFADFHVRVK